MPMQKRVFDITLLLLAAPVVIPILALTAVVLRITLGSPIFFVQERPGLFEKPFCMVKFRTMRNTRDVNGDLLADEQRISSIGRFLRSASLDELPALWNVLKGDMSLVGPRPLLMEYLPLYTPSQARRHTVVPGITGWAQIQGRNSLSWEVKFELDAWYVENNGLWLDTKILFSTIWRVIKRDGITADDHATMPHFSGTDSSANKQ